MNKIAAVAAFMMRIAAAERVRVTVYDEVAVPGNVWDSVVENVQRIFRQSGVEIEWAAGLPEADEASLFLYPGPLRKGRELEMVCRARRDIALKISFAFKGVPSGTLGMAQPMTPAGLNVRIFDDRVREAAKHQNRLYPLVLAHVIAHEIGHVLLRSNSHDAYGLMGRRWSDYEYQRMALGLIFFTPDQSRRMRTTLRNDVCKGVELPPDQPALEEGEPETSRLRASTSGDRKGLRISTHVKPVHAQGRNLPPIPRATGPAAGLTKIEVLCLRCGRRVIADLALLAQVVAPNTDSTNSRPLPPVVARALSFLRMIDPAQVLVLTTAADLIKYLIGWSYSRRAARTDGQRSQAACRIHDRPSLSDIH